MNFVQQDQLINNGCSQDIKNKRKDILELLSAAFERIDPYHAVAKNFNENTLQVNEKKIDLSKYDHIYCIGFGKASVKMADAACDKIQITAGIVITNDDRATVEDKRITTYHGNHPIPTKASIQATKSIEQLIEKCEENDLLIVLISGGGSALLIDPHVSLKDLQHTTKLLLSSGATINEINTIRKHLSKVKGGQLIKNASCEIVSLIISDVVGDPLEFIASGPTCGDSTTFHDALEIVEKYQLVSRLPSSVVSYLQKGKENNQMETPKPTDDLFQRVHNCIIANNTLACEAIKEKAKILGYKPMILTSMLTGEAREIGPWLIHSSQKQRKKNEFDVYIAGGETTVTVKGTGSGGRNQEMVLSVVRYIQDSPLVFCSCATDGMDGMSSAAGAICDGKSFHRAQKLNLDINQYLHNNDSFTFFNQLQDVLITGLTGTNVMDLQIIIL